MSTPRYTFCFGTPEVDEKEESYPKVTFRKKTYQSEPIPDWLNVLKDQAEAKTGTCQ